ncbi:MAG: DUF1800 domain-containing protein [Planctomycetes bacterium]|nr:DUF1800 domain-containing protein [Planctomycetota bacterium]
MADTSETRIDPRWAWEAYRPNDKAPWDLKRAGHLYRRAAFGATPTELQAALKKGPQKAIDDLLAGGPGQDAFDKQTEQLAESIVRVNNGQQLRDWWLYRMLYTPHPLREKFTLFWHNHFATSNATVQNAGFMYRQYRLLRKYVLGSFAEMLKEMSLDPAMMVWLNVKDSKKGNPNENYARELMELFSLGIGNYTEHDIREAARAFTGWTLQGNDVVYTESQHDLGEKSVLKQKGKWKPDDIVRICLEEDSAPYFLTKKLFRFLVSETMTPSRELLEPLATSFRKSGYDFGDLVRTVLRSNLFFSDQVYRTRIKAPVDFALGIVRGLEGRIGSTPLAGVLEQLGQSVLYPPSVKGWDGGEAWLNGQTLLFRQNLALALTSTEDIRFGHRCDPAALARKYGKKDDKELVDFFLDLFLQGDVAEESRSRLLLFQEKSHKMKVPVYWTAQDAADNRVRTLCHLVLTQPEFQLD